LRQVCNFLVPQSSTQAMDLSPQARQPLVETQEENAPRSPVKFDVPIRSPKKADAMTPGRARLEGYLNSPIAGVPTPNTPSRLLRKEILAEQAREANAKKREITDRIKVEQEKATEAKRRDIERDQEEAKQRREAKLLETSSPKGRKVNVSDLREKEAQAVVDLKAKLFDELNKAKEKAIAAIADRGARAGQHNEAVTAKRAGVLQRREEEMQTQKGQLETDMVQKEEKRKEAVAGRGAKAGQHNEAVAAKLSEMQLCEEPQKRAASLNAALDAHALKAEAKITLRSERAGQHNEKVTERLLQVQQNQQVRQKEILTKWEQKTGSKVPGEPFSRIEKGSSGATTGLAITQADAASSQQKKTEAVGCCFQGIFSMKFK